MKAERLSRVECGNVPFLSWGPGRQDTAWEGIAAAPGGVGRSLKKPAPFVSEGTRPLMDVFVAWKAASLRPSPPEPGPLPQSRGGHLPTLWPRGGAAVLSAGRPPPRLLLAARLTLKEMPTLSAPSLLPGFVGLSS